MSYHHYPPTPLGGLRATEEGACDTSESEAVQTHVQRTPASFSIKSTLRPNPRSSSLASSSKKCDTIATNAEWEMGPVSSCDIDPAFKQLRCHGH
jgi:hypothetical protein